MKTEEYDDEAVLGAIAASGARVLLIGRKALVVLGLPVLTNDYDLWIAIDDIALLNEALDPLNHFPNKTPEQARLTGRYVLESGERIESSLRVMRRRRTAPSDSPSMRPGLAGRRSPSRPAVRSTLDRGPHHDETLGGAPEGHRRYPAARSIACCRRAVKLEYPDLTAEEFERGLALARAELEDPDCLEELASHIRWFLRRYPTPLDRLRYVRRKYADWSRTRGIGSEKR